jgi:hypothetical protein
LRQELENLLLKRFYNGEIHAGIINKHGKASFSSRHGTREKSDTKKMHCLTDTVDKCTDKQINQKGNNAHANYSPVASVENLEIV